MDNHGILNADAGDDVWQVWVSDTGLRELASDS